MLGIQFFRIDLFFSVILNKDIDFSITASEFLIYLRSGSTNYVAVYITVSLNLFDLPKSLKGRGNSFNEVLSFILEA